jgi:hypothetical protein
LKASERVRQLKFHSALVFGLKAWLGCIETKPSTITQSSQPLVAVSHDFSIGIPCSVVRLVVTSQQFARSITEPIFVNPANDFAGSVSDIIVAAHKVSPTVIRFKKNGEVLPRNSFAESLQYFANTCQVVVFNWKLVGFHFLIKAFRHIFRREDEQV